MHHLKNNINGFTLFELMVSIAVFGILMITILYSVGNMGIARIKSENRIALLEQLYFFSENLITQIKEGGTIDYEEYWNRMSYNTEIGSGHYIYPTGVGNYGSGGDIHTNSGKTLGEWFYFCRSENWTRMWVNWCLEGFNTGNPSTGIAGWSYSWKYQRYWQYFLQFTDYNMNASADLWDENSDGNIRDDDDDKDIGDGPYAFSGTMPELYLMSPEDKTRIFFRWTLRDDPDAPAGNTCTYTGPNMWSGCLGNIQILKLKWYDIGQGHSGTSLSSTGSFDGNIDTWTCEKDWSCQWYDLLSGYGILATGKDAEWMDLFPSFINVKSLSFIAYPQKNSIKAWAAPDVVGWWTNSTSPFIHPYVRLNLTLGFGWKKRKTIKNDDPTISISTSVSLWTLGDGRIE
jgi:prepilin-type N-terminal cleavage/methylation domain-containing protein